MSRPRSLVTLSALVSGTLVLSGCGVIQQLSDNAAEPTDENPVESEDLAQVGHDPLVREARLFVDTGQDASIEVAIEALERTDEYTVLYLDFTFLDQLTGTNDNLSSPPRLMDPVSGRVYEPLVDPVTEEGYGSIPSRDGYFPIYENAPNKWRFYYPPVPRHVTHMTFTGYGVGAMTGVPVTDVDEFREPDAPNVLDYDDNNPPPAGTEVTYELAEPGPEAEPQVVSLESFVDSTVASTTRDGDSETVALHSDVTFDVDETTLTDDAEEIVLQASQTIESNIDPDNPEVTVIGHTDSTGSDSYNMTLSEERAETVRDLLEDELGSDYTFEVEGRASEEPVAEEGGSDDDEAAARNRRVEFSYQVDVEAEGESDEGLDAASRNVAAPAAFQEDDGEIVATEEYDDVQLDVYPLVRDGAYIVTTVSLTNTTDDPVELDLSSDDATLDGGPDTFSEGTLGGFQLVEPDNDLVRYVAQLKYDVDGEEEYAGFAEEVHALQAGEDYRVMAIFPAPAQDVDNLTLNAGPFGEIEDVPIEN